jgi:hypothetical protein
MAKNQKLVGSSPMETVTHCRAMLAFCRQRALMDGEDERFWLTEAEMWQKRMIRADLAETLETMPSNIEQEKNSPTEREADA